MPTHHGRPGGRFLELAGLFALIMLSIASFAIIPFIWIKVTALSAHHRIGRSFGRAIVAVYMVWIWALAYPWRAFLRYYKYDPHSLKPLKEPTNDGESD